MRLLLSLSLAALLAAPALACDDHQAADGKTGHDCAARCPHATAAEAGAHKGCPMAAASTTVKAVDTAPGKGLHATGKVLCAHCDLKQSDSCRPVFQETRSKATYTLATSEATEKALLQLTRHGEVEVTIQGKIAKDEAGTEVLLVDGFSVGTI